jgi:hypothetical protein
MEAMKWECERAASHKEQSDASQIIRDGLRKLWKRWLELMIQH